MRTLTNVQAIVGLLVTTAGSAFAATAYLSQLAKAEDLNSLRAQVEVLKESQRNTEKNLDKIYNQLQDIAREMGIPPRK